MPSKIKRLLDAVANDEYPTARGENVKPSVNVQSGRGGYSSARVTAAQPWSPPMAAPKNMPPLDVRKERITRNLDVMTPVQRRNLGRAQVQTNYKPPSKTATTTGLTVRQGVKELAQQKTRLEYEKAGGVKRGIKKGK